MTLVLKVLSVIVSPNNAQHQERFVGSWKEERDVRDDSKHVGVWKRIHREYNSIIPAFIWIEKEMK